MSTMGVSPAPAVALPVDRQSDDRQSCSHGRRRARAASASGETIRAYHGFDGGMPRLSLGDDEIYTVTVSGPMGPAGSGTFAA